jgi:acyl CoA:acetate/3-ketoacid CoA transferase
MASVYKTVGELREAFRDIPDDTPLHTATVVMGTFYKPGVEAGKINLVRRRNEVSRAKTEQDDSYLGVVFY